MDPLLVSTKVVILTADIDGHFRRDVARINIPNAFFWDDNDGKFLMRL